MARGRAGEVASPEEMPSLRKVPEAIRFKANFPFVFRIILESSSNFLTLLIIVDRSHYCYSSIDEELYFVSIDFKELRELLGAIAQTDITEFSLKNEDFELTVKKGFGASSLESMRVDVSSPAMLSNSTSPKLMPQAEANNNNNNERTETPLSSAVDKKWTAITSPMVGTFYRASAPDEAPFVEVGDRVSKTQTVCIIEAMKLMNEIESELSGVVMEVLVENGQPVEYGQNLMWVKAE
jgi:acetyl-CoA carboxylase biotin carboxyl carrier protein